MTERTKIGILVALLALWTWVYFGRRSAPTPPGSLVSATRGGKAGPAIPDAVLRVERLTRSDRAQAGEVRRNIFDYQRRAPERAGQVQVQEPPPPPPPKPSPPPVRFYGFAAQSGGGSRRVFLTDGDEIFIVGEGDVFQKRYRLVKVGKDNVEVEELAGNRRWVVPLEQP